MALSVADGDRQFVLPGALAELALSIRATDPTRGTAMEDVPVTWRVTAGQGATVTAIDARTDGEGIASAQASVGQDTGTYRIEASAAKLSGDPAVFTLRAVRAPAIAGAAPLPAVAGQTVTIDGSGFSDVAADNLVLFGGFRGNVRSATTTRLVVDVPRCVASGQTELRVALGPVTSPPETVQTIAAQTVALNLAPGQATRIDTPADLACVQFEDVSQGARFLVVTQNAAPTFSLPMRYELLVNATSPEPELIAGTRPDFHTDRASSFELELRRRERAFGPITAADSAVAARRPIVPAVGDRDDFNVLTSSGGTRRITAVVRAISQRAILYVDQEAPASGLTTIDLQNLGAMFDDPIYTTDTGVFGQPSDVDANGRIIILFTPAVNALTDDDGGGFIAGYFYGCDLVDSSRCSATNGGEIFYSIVPDPNGAFGGVRTKDVVLRTVPAVLAHEFQHMINFSRKGGRLDVLWLSEGLAHAAEDIVGEVFAARGNMQTAGDFRRPNYTRARLYLGQTSTTALVGEESPGTLEQRGAAWLLVKYASLHYGGNTLLERLTSSTSTGAVNMAGATGRPWREMLAEFATALWADRAPELATAPQDAHFTFDSFDLRAAINSLSGSYPLAPAAVPFVDLLQSGSIAAASAEYLMLEAPTAQAALDLAFTGLHGGPFATASAPQLILLRVR